MNNISERVKKILEWDNILAALNSRCYTEKGKALVNSLNILAKEKAVLQLKQISELKELVGSGHAPDFSGISDIEPLLNIADKDGVLQISELRQVKDFLTASERIYNYFRTNKNKLINLSGELKELNRFDRLEELLASSITEYDELNLNKYKELKNLHGKIISVKKEIESKCNKIIHSSDKSAAIQEKVLSVRNDRYVILVKAEMKGSIKGSMHDISSSGATLYIEPNEIIPLNNKLIAFENDLKVKIYKILKSLTQEVSEHTEKLRINTAKLAFLDFITAAAKLSVSIKGNEPVISENIIELHNARHPLLCLMNPDLVVPNDVSISREHKCIIISGANTGGKTVLLKTIGLCALMAMHGLHIPAGPDSRICLFFNILADIGDDQNIEQSLSTYSGQIVVIDEMLKKAVPGTLILIDELLVGTNPRQGAALARAVLEAFVETDAVVILTTHYSELKELPVSDKRFQNASVSFDLDTLKPTYKLIQGLPGTSYAIEIARNYGLNEKIIQRSKELLDSSESSAEALLENIQRHNSIIDEEYRKIKNIKHELELQKKANAEKEQKLKTRAAELKNEKGIEFLEDIKRQKDDLIIRIKSLRTESIAEHEKLQRDISVLQEKISDSLKKDRIDQYFEKYKNHNGMLKTGESVLIISLEKTGIVEETDDINKTAVVVLGPSVKARFDFKDILIPVNRVDISGRREEKEKEVNRSQPDRIPLTVQTNHNTSDLRGLRVDEALAKLDRDLDRMIKNNICSAVIIHGHGTGALKNAVREWLKYSFYVDNFRSGEQNEGGDGVSIAMLKN